MIKIRVPATSANMGAGFDCLGVALSLYNYITVEEIPNGLVIDVLDAASQGLPRNESNLIYRAMKRVFNKAGFYPSGIHLTLENNIKIARGLGSSSAGIVGGLVAANIMCGERFTNDELIEIAVNMEGHPDNVVSAILGGFNVAVSDKSGTNYVNHKLPDDLRFAAFVPDFTLRTVKSRSVLPKTVMFDDAVYNLGRASLLASSIITGKYGNIRATVGDKLHERYRHKLIPNMGNIIKMCYSYNALGVYLSGSGPTVVAIVHKDNSEFISTLSRILSKKPALKDWKVHLLTSDNEGAKRID